MKRNLPKLVLIVAVILATASGLVISSRSLASRGEPNWLTGDAQYTPGAAFGMSTECTEEDITVQGIGGRLYANNNAYHNFSTYTQHRACVYDTGYYRYAYYARDFYLSLWPGTTTRESMVALAVGSQLAFTPVDGLGDRYSDIQMYLGSDSAAFIQHGSTDNGFRVYRDLLEHISQDETGNMRLDNNPDFTYVDSDGNQLPVEGVGISLNKKWISFGVVNFGILLYSVDSNQVVRISDRYNISNSTWPRPALVTSVSDNGAYVIVSGTAYQTELIHTSGCGSSELARSPIAYNSAPLGGQVCSYSALTEMINAHSVAHGNAGLRRITKVQMNASGSMFTYWDTYAWGTIYAPNYLMPGQLYYLALGDSYASGDGDITLDGADHYLPGTNIYGDYTKGIARETCHISTRSYPMRIATAMELTSGVDMRSVACSGAVMSDILSADKKDAGYVNTSYLGQSTQQISKSGPRLEGIVNASALQAEARTSYIPGRVQQIELVKKSQPKYATIMVGGNDIDFPGVMMACAKNSLPSADETCDYARGSGLAGQAKKVYDLYPKLVAFYEALQEVAPRTTFYAIGYPQFMDATNESCVEMLNLYSQAEREAIHNLISYANGIIRAAANDAGVKYINIENSLTGMELCSSGTGMTGMLDTFATVIYTEYMKSLTMSDSVLAKYLNILPVGAPHELALRLYVAERSAALLAGIMYSPATAISDISQELSHPNAIGHDAIYKSIRDTLGADLLESNVCGGKVSCPTGAVTGRPSIGTYLPGVTVRDGVVYISGNGHVQIERKDSKGKVTTGALIKGVADQLIRIVLDILEGEVDISAPVIVEIHSQPTVLGTMSKVGEGYELDVALPDSVPAGQHVLHIRGQLVDGQQFDIDSPVFVEGPEGDIDDDGISDSVDTCAFAEPTGIDVDEDGTDDKCDLDVSFGTTEGPYGGGLGDGEVEVSMRSMSGDDRNNSPGLSKQMLFAGTGFQGQVGDGILDSTDVSLQRVTDTVADGVDQSSAIWAISAVLFVFGTSLFISRARRAKRS